MTALRDRGVRAVKLRFHHDDWRRDVEVVEQVRAAVGPTSRSWSTPTRAGAWPATAPRAGTSRPPPNAPARSSRSASTGSRSRCATDDVEGYALLRRRTSLRIAAGEMVRSLFEARDLILRGGVDVVQPDVVLAGGLGGCRRIAALADLCGRAFSPHTWTNGFGLLANLHLAAAVSTCPYIEVPFDPPGWTPDRRDWLLGGPRSRSRRTGRSRRLPGPGLGVVPDLDRLEEHRVA